MFKILKSLYENYTQKEVDKQSQDIDKYINSSSFYNEHLNAAKEAITAFNSSPKSSQDLKNLYTVLHSSVKHCSEQYTHYQHLTQIISRDIIEYKMHITIHSLL